MQAPQAARAKQSQDGQPQNEIRKVRESFEAHMQALDESDSSDSATHLHVDAELPEHQSPDGRKRRRGENSAQLDSTELSNEQPASPPSPSTKPGSDDTLYRHLDVVI